MTTERKPGQHCWHDTGMVLQTSPPKYPQVCCWCGTWRNRKSKPMAGHGAHAPSSDYVDDERDIDLPPCSVE